MKTKKNNKLDFTKSSIAELNDTTMLGIDGGTSPITASSEPCLHLSYIITTTLFNANEGIDIGN